MNRRLKLVLLPFSAILVVNVNGYVIHRRRPPYHRSHSSSWSIDNSFSRSTYHPSGGTIHRSTRKSIGPGNNTNNNKGGDEKDPVTQVKATGPIAHAAAKFSARPGTYLLIPCIAALVGWFTNYLAVQMIFYPIQYRGLPLWRKEEVPLGLIGWQGIVPCKTKPMSEAMVNMVTSQLLTVQEAFGRLDPRKVAKLLEPRVPILGEDVLREVVPQKWMVGVPGAIFRGLPFRSQSILKHYNLDFLENLVKDMQRNVDSIFNIKNCVIEQMLQDRTLLGQLFKKCGQKELDFLTNSGLYVGFGLGLIQMGVALFCDNPWTLSIGGCIVGYATNWIALKWIFEPVNPTRIGPFVLQGQFLRRQQEVAKEFSNFFANRILTSQQVWKSILNDPMTYPNFQQLFTNRFGKFVKRIGSGLRLSPEPETLQLITNKALDKLPDHIHVLHPYIDETLGLQETLRIKMEQMTSSQFERVLHPIFEEDELTLILAGAGLGLIAGLIQQGLETGAIKLTLPKPIVTLGTKLTTFLLTLITVIRRKLIPDRYMIAIQSRLTVLQNKIRSSSQKMIPLRLRKRIRRRIATAVTSKNSSSSSSSSSNTKSNSSNYNGYNGTKGIIMDNDEEDQNKVNGDATTKNDKKKT